MYLVFIMTMYFTLATVRLLYLFHKWKQNRKNRTFKNSSSVISPSGNEAAD